MALNVLWSPEAEKTFEKTIKYLKNEWTEKEVKNFVHSTNKLIRLISENPTAFKASKKRNIRICVISKHNSLFYKIKNTEKVIILLSFWDTRQNPNKIKY